MYDLVYEAGMNRAAPIAITKRPMAMPFLKPVRLSITDEGNAHTKYEM